MERRLRPRTAVELPIAIFAVDGKEVNWPATTRNMSSGGGVCFAGPHSLTVGQRVGYVVTLSQGAAPVRIGCVGAVVRCTPGPDPENPLYETAVTMERYRFIPDGEAPSPRMFAPGSSTSDSVRRDSLY